MSRIDELMAQYGDTQAYLVALEAEVERLTKERDEAHAWERGFASRVSELEAEAERYRKALRSLYDGACDAWNRMAGYGAVDPELVLPLLAGPLDKAKHALEVKDA